MYPLKSELYILQTGSTNMFLQKIIKYDYDIKSIPAKF